MDSQILYDNLWYFTVENPKEVTFEELRNDALQDYYLVFYSRRFRVSKRWLKGGGDGQ